MADFMSDGEVRRVLENSRVGQEPKQHLIEAALKDLPELPLNLARLLVRKSRTALARAIQLTFEQLVEEERADFLGPVPPLLGARRCDHPELMAAKVRGHFHHALRARKLELFQQSSRDLQRTIEELFEGDLYQRGCTRKTSTVGERNVIGHDVLMGRHEGD
jgi:hypothetical protein